MNRTTINFGIDLGTTNSAIAVLRGTVTDIIRNNENNEITPSAVSLDKSGTLRVGTEAKNYLGREEAGDDVYIEFKRRMGTSHQYNFKSANRHMLPEELSAEVLKNLLGDVQQREEEVIQSAVITVPAAFELNQCSATRKAGELAGLNQCPLLQEPVAAALAYGYQKLETSKGYWFVYDFGGGTFDAAIVKAEDGTISCVNNGGDNLLGGSNIDWAVIERIVVPQIEGNFNLPDFKRGNKKWRTAFAIIKRAVEEKKIQLSRRETVQLECRFADADSKMIDLDVKLTRNMLVDVAEPIIMSSVEISKRVLKEKNLGPSAIEHLILVGGPTLAPYFREILKANLGITLELSVDPLTVVARGAAVFAGTQRITLMKKANVSAGQFNIDLKFNSIGIDEDPTIQGKVSGRTSENMDGYTIEFLNEQWRSGKVPLKENGNFKVTILAEKGRKNDYVIELFDKANRKQTVVPDRMSYTIGVDIKEQTVINSMGLALTTNQVDVFFKKGDSLPATSKRRPFKTSHAVRKGSDDEILHIPVVEGEAELADGNKLLGKLLIKGTQIRRDVPTGSDVDIQLHMDTSRILKVNAYISILDEEFEAIIDFNKKEPDAKRLQLDYEAEIERLNAIRNKVAGTEVGKVENILDDVQASNKLEEINNLLSAAKGDIEAAGMAEKKLLEIKVMLGRAEDALKWPALVSQANQKLDQLDEMVREHGNEDQQKRASEYRKQIEELIKQKRSERLKRKIDQTLSLYWEMRFAQPSFWVGYFNYLIDEQRSKMKDQDTVERLVGRGQEFIANGNVEGLRSVVSQLRSLLPDDVAEQINRAYDSGLLLGINFARE